LALFVITAAETTISNVIIVWCMGMWWPCTITVCDCHFLWCGGL